MSWRVIARVELIFIFLFGFGLLFLFGGVDIFMFFLVDHDK